MANLEHKNARRRCERPGHGQPDGVDVTQDSAGPFSNLNRGEWETIGDRIKRRPLFTRSVPDKAWLYEVEISRNYEGEIFTATTRFPPEMWTDFDRIELNRVLVNWFFNTMADAVEQKDDPWIMT